MLLMYNSNCDPESYLEWTQLLNLKLQQQEIYG